MPKKLLWYSLLSALIVAVLHFISIQFYFYWTIWWIDNVMHFLGGLTIGFVTFLFFRLRYSLGLNANLKSLFIIVIPAVIIVGIGWEVFELFSGTTFPSDGESYWQDTTYDLIDDTLGAIVATFFVYKEKLHV